MLIMAFLNHTFFFCCRRDDTSIEMELMCFFMVETISSLRFDIKVPLNNSARLPVRAHASFYFLYLFSRARVFPGVSIGAAKKKWLVRQTEPFSSAATQ